MRRVGIENHDFRISNECKFENKFEMNNEIEI